MRVGFRTDASTDSGTGHVMRCLTLAEELRMQGAEVFFMCRRRPGDLVDFIQQKRFAVYAITGAEGISWREDAARSLGILDNVGIVDWLIVDHYDLDARWERVLKSSVKRLMVIDDLADRPHDCHLLLDQNLYPDMDKRYEGRIPDGTVKLLGPAYTLLREEFILEAERLSNPNGTLERILVSFGGSDPTNETLKALKAILMLEKQPEVDVVIGKSNPYQTEILAFCKKVKEFHLHIQTNEIARLMQKADIAIGAGGGSVWERCYMNLPSIVIETASNQTEIIAFLEEKGAIFNLGKSEKVRVEDIYKQLQELDDDSSIVLQAWKSIREIMKDHERYGVTKYLMGGDHHD
ncbi:UDP-2,4-diacetamido-2,4,6-trideoxy-beta-L-altropyranose hydrolase [Halobacillus sp. H74]|uniref:UDP-2,4-diacetamido-2,4, 6-trideoxy-beta-L-altropyranose hydrolase n=1 Tax=Halobacillus sp. H74 TaxID=3457436 RepID=UPI003FCC86C8